MDAEPKVFMPPYNLPWATFLSTLEKLAADPPNRVDRSYLSSQSGAVQTYLIAALRAFYLIDDSARPTQALVEFANQDMRKEFVAGLLREHYPTVVVLGETNSTVGELEEAFAKAYKSLTGESRRKAIRFFLGAASYAELKLSPMWKVPKAPRGIAASRRQRRSTGSPASNGAAESATVKPKAASLEEMRLAYFDLLINNADKETKLDQDVLNRIERLVGIAATASDGEAHDDDAADGDQGDEMT